MNKNLFLSVLAMDSYNQGYDSGIAIGSGPTHDLGTAIFLTDKGDVAAQSQSFYAVAYQYNGETIISYRGTDGAGDLGADLTIGLGNPNTAQAYLAAEFYRNAALGQDPYSANVTFVGHSLGGGLAGLMAGIYGREAAIFDNMAFRDAASGVHDGAEYIRENPALAADLILAYGDLDRGFYGNTRIENVNFTQISGWQTAGQFLAFQSEGTTLGGTLPLSGTLGPVDLHSISLLVTLIYASDTANVDKQDWKGIALPLVSQLYSAEIAAAAGITQNGTSQIAEAMRTMIAYSVIDEGAMPFGNTAIKTMFEDANEVAVLFGNSSKSLLTSSTPVKEASETSLCEIIVQHAAQLANGHVAENGGADRSIVVQVDGVCDAISVDKVSAAWSGASSIVGWDDLKHDVKEMLSLSDTTLSSEANAILNGVDFVVLGQTGILNAETVKNTLNDGYHLSDAAHANALVIGTTEVDKVTGTANDDLIITGAGNDTLVGGDGVDALYGGDGNDVLVLGNINGVNKASPREVVDGGAGTDYIVVTGALGSTVTVGKGDAGDRLLIHASLLGEGGGGDGKIGMFNLLGGVYGAFPGIEARVPISINADCNLFRDSEGKQFRAFYLPELLMMGYGGRTYYTVDTLRSGPTVEYRLYEGEQRLEIRILGEGDPNYFFGKILDPKDRVLPVLQTIEITNFTDGDYGIHFAPVFLPFGDVPASIPYFEDTLEKYNALRKLDVVEAYSKAVHAIWDNAFAYSLDSDGTFHGAGTASLFAAAKDITAENLVIAIDGGAKADVLVGNDRAEHISGGAGDDVIRGEGGADLLDGGDGVDTLDYSTSKLGVVVNLALGTASDGDNCFNFEAIIGSAHADHLTGDAGANRLTGGFGADVLDGSFGFDFADYSFSFEGVIADLSKGQGFGGDAEGDTFANIEGVTGSALRDMLIGDAANNWLEGGAGNDTLIGGAGGDVLNGGDGTDLADYRDSYLGVSVNLGNGTGAGGDAEGDTLLAIENLKGSQFNDVLVGSDANNSIDGHDGDDLLVGGAGDDRLNGGAGNDTLRGDAGADVLVGGLGVDVVDYTYSDAGVTVDLKTGAGQGGAAQGDLIAGVENLTGSQFADILSGDVHDNSLAGGAAADIFVFDRNFGHDVIVDFETGTDRVQLTGTAIHNFDDLLSHVSETAGGIHFTITANDRIDFTGLNLDQLKASDFIFT